MFVSKINSNMDFKEKNTHDWEKVISEIFPEGIPQSYCWTDREEIINILNIIGSIHNLNHMFFPTGGGLDLTGSKNSFEKDCIELLTGGLYDLIKPSVLMFEKISENLDWSYFRIETHQLDPSGVYEKIDGNYEEVTELEPNIYVDRSVWDQNEFKGKPLQKSARVISRFFKGAFVIFKKSSIYNRTSSTYDGRHNKMTAEEFKTYILKAAKNNGV